PPLPLRRDKLRSILARLTLTWDRNSGREAAYKFSEENRRLFWHWLMDPAQVSDDEMNALGLVRIPAPQDYKIGDTEGQLRKIEVHSVRPARRVGADGDRRSDLVVEITQSFRPKASPQARFRGGCTLLIDLVTAEVRYLVRKKVNSPQRMA